MNSEAKLEVAQPSPEAVTSTLPANEAEQSKKLHKSVWREYFEFIAVTFIMFLFGMTFNVQAVEIPTGSMQNTILIGDHLLVNKFIFAPGTHVPFLPQREIRRGDIIVFKYPGNRERPELDSPDTPPYKTFFVKRVIGLPGDLIETRGTQVFVNGQPLPEHLIIAVDHNDKTPDEILEDTPRKNGEAYNVYYKPRAAGQTSPDEFDRTYFRYGVEGQPTRVPDNQYFAMGDNRDNSADSRVWGLVPRDLIFGRPMFVLWSYDNSAPPGNTGITEIFRHIRWTRSGTMIK
ncbi:MAG: signal peptidase I [Pyrinomonadaceae bacterium]